MMNKEYTNDKSFVEKFPSLAFCEEYYNYEEDVDGIDLHIYSYKKDDIMNYCLDKKVIKDAIYRYLKSNRGTARDLEDFIYFLGEELKLKEVE